MTPGQAKTVATLRGHMEAKRVFVARYRPRDPMEDLQRAAIEVAMRDLIARSCQTDCPREVTDLSLEADKLYHQFTRLPGYVPF